MGRSSGGRSSGGRSSGGRSSGGRGRSGGSSASIGILIFIIDTISYAVACVIEFLWFRMDKVLGIGLGKEEVSEKAIFDYREERKENIQGIVMVILYIVFIIVVFYCYINS